jgi:hypothetical protein
MKTIAFVFSALILAASINSSAVAGGKGYFYDKDGVIAKGMTIMITEYSPSLEGVFEVQTEKDYGRSSYYTRIGDLRTASAEIKKGNYRKKPRNLEGKKFKLDADLVIYTYPEYQD